MASVVFNNSSAGSPDSYYWDFGDGGTSTLANPTYNYNFSGVYVVRLTATKVGVGSTISKAVPIQAGPIAFTLMANNEGATLATNSGTLIAAVVG